MWKDQYGVEFSDDKKTLVKCPWGIEYYNIPKGTTEIGYGAFSGCSTIKSIDIPNSVTCIRRWAFSNTINLQNITIPDSVVCIEKEAFGSDHGKNVALERVSIGKGLKKNDNARIFASRIIKKLELNSQELVDDYDGTNLNPLYSMCGSPIIEKIVLGSNITKIGRKSLFKGRLISISIPESVVSIGEKAFTGSSIETITIPSKINNIQSSTFEGCEKLSSVVVPDIVEEIKDSAFARCFSLKLFSFPKHLNNIDNNAFCYTALEEISLPIGLRRIGEGAFKSSKIRKVTLPSSLNIIGNDAFADCRELSEIVVPLGQKDKFEQFKALEEYKYLIKEESPCIGQEEYNDVKSQNISFSDGKLILLHYGRIAEKDGNIEVAVSLYEDAEKLGSMEAVYRLGLIFLGQDFYKGYFYVNKAAKAGHVKAIEKLKQLQSQR